MWGVDKIIVKVVQFWLNNENNQIHVHLDILQPTIKNLLHLQKSFVEAFLLSYENFLQNVPLHCPFLYIALFSVSQF